MHPIIARIVAGKQFTPTNTAHRPFAFPVLLSSPIDDGLTPRVESFVGRDEMLP
jgi:hypothetical protein